MNTITEREFAVEVDTLLAGLLEAEAYHAQRWEIAATRVRRAAGQHQVPAPGASRWGDKVWDGSIEDAVQARLAVSPEPADLVEYREQADIWQQIFREMSDGHSVWEEHRWNRAYLVTNAGGHVHASTTCSTCFDSTKYEWLVAYSGADELEIVGDAGEMACTVCYPSAPSDLLNRPANLISVTRSEKQAAKVQRAAEKVEREAKRKAKAPTSTGDALVVPEDQWGSKRVSLGTEVTARQCWNGIEQRELDFASGGWGRQASEAQIESQHLIVAALADKHGVTVEEIREDLIRKFAKRRT